MQPSTRLLTAAALMLLCAPLIAAPALADTPKEATGHGVVMIADGANTTLAFTPEGKFTVYVGMISGSWRSEGDKLCAISDETRQESCLAYPKDRKSGDSFDLATSNGTVAITIK